MLETSTTTNTVQRALEQGFTLPTTWYTGAKAFLREQAPIFRRTWQYVGLTEQVAQPGDFFTARVGLIPVVVTRDHSGDLHAFVNVCRHRGAQVILAESGHRATLQCHYHAWTYDLDGKLRAAPGMADEPGFDKTAFGLHTARVETWGPFVFVNLDPAAAPLVATLGELPALVAATGLDFAAIKRRVHRTYEIQANWKVVVDNYLECYHCPVAHPGFCDLIDTNQYHVTEYEYFSTQTGALKAAAQRGEGSHGFDATHGVAEGFYAYLWPNFTLNIYPGPGNVSLNLFLPLAPDRTLAIYDYCFADAVSQSDSDQFVRFIDQVQDEDTVLCESVQRGMSTGYFTQGKLMLSRERALHHFQKLVLRTIEGG